MDIEFDNDFYIGLGLGAVMAAAIWFLPGIVGLKGYSLWNKIILSIALLVVGPFITKWIANR